MMNPYHGAPGGGMPDPFGSMQNMMGQLQQFAGNPLQYMMMRGLNIPANLQNDPGGMIQHLMNTGAMSQQQYNALRQMKSQVENNPQFSQMFGRR